MPHVVNGVGTWYYGKRNLRVRRGVCQFCNNLGDLQSYETTLFIVFFFIPVIPIGTKRINDDCPRCRRHTVISLKKWIEARDESIAKHADELDAHPDDLQVAMRAIGTAAYFDAKDEYLGLTASLSPALLREPELLNALGDAHRHFGLGVEAADYYRQSISIKPDRAISLRMAAVLYHYGKLAEATQVAEGLLSEHKWEDAWLLGMYVAALQSAGTHDRALAMLDGFAAANPAIVKDKQYKKMRKVSEKHLHSGKPIATKVFNVKEFKESGGSARFTVARVIPVIVGTLVLGMYLWVAIYKGQNRDVYLVNGTSYAYEVAIGSQKFSMRAESERMISVPEDVYTVTVNHQLNLIPAFQADLTTNFLARPFHTPVVVLNPDSLGLVLKCTSYYARNPQPSTYELFTGKPIHEFGSIDCPFTPLPQTVSLSSNSSQAIRTGLEIAPATNFASLGVVSHYKGPGGVTDRVVNGLKVDPDCETYELASGAVPPEDLEKTIEPLLKMRPVIVNAHRLHQDLCEAHHPKFDLAGEYQSLLKTDPKDSTLRYLVARITHEPKEKMAAYLAASEGANPQPFAVRTLAICYLDSGEFELASKYAEQMMKLIPWDESGQHVNRAILSARGKYDACLDTPQLRGSPASASLREAEDKVVCLAAMHKHAEAEQFIQAYMAELEDRAGAWRDHMLGLLAYCEGDIANWTKYNQPGGMLNFDALVHSGAIADAVKVLKEDALIEERLILVMAAYGKGDSTVALAQLDLAVNELAAGGVDDQLAAKWLAGTATPTEQQLLYCAPRGLSRPLFLTVLGQRRPELAPMCFPLARTLNFDPRFPHKLIEQVLSQPSH